MNPTSEPRKPVFGKRPHMIGGHVTGPLVVARTTRAVVVFRQVLAYPNGIEIHVEAHGHGTSRDLPKNPIIDKDVLLRMLDDRPRFSVCFADGRTASEDDDLADGSRDDRPIILPLHSGASRGGSSRDEDIDVSLWIQPLPPGGPVSITCSWPRAGIEQVSVSLNGHEIVAAAQSAQPFYSEP